MKRLKTFGIYLLLIVGFFFFSRALIFIGLNNTYDNITYKSNLPEGVSISSSKATNVNGEIKGTLSNTISEKYIKFDFYTDIDSIAGSHYLDVSKFKNKNFEFYFKLNNIEYFTVTLTNDAPESKDLENFSLEPYSSYTLFGLLLVAMFI